MRIILRYISWFFTILRFIFHIMIYYVHPKHKILYDERNIWIKIIRNTDTYSIKDFIWLLRFVPEYRSVFYFRIGSLFSRVLSILAGGRQQLFLNTASKRVGTGLVIQHGFSTIVEAERIGERCQIWHNVTVGTNISHSGNKPTIGDNVKICAGAIVLGRITIGNNVTIGAGAVVVKDIPDNCVVVGNPAKIIKKDGYQVSIPLSGPLVK